MNQIMINIFLIIPIFILVAAIGIAIYNFLFFYQSKQTEKEINIILPSILKKVLLFNLAISVSVIVLATLMVLKIIV